MEGRDQNRRKPTKGRKKRTTYEDLRRESTELVPVPEHVMGFVIGKQGNTIKQIQEQSRAKVTSQDKPSGFMVRGNEEQIACAKELIIKKAAEIHKGGNRFHTPPGQQVKIPRQFTKVVNGPGGDNLRNVSTLTGAEVTGNPAHGLYVTGAEKEVQHAKFLLKNRVAGTRVRPNTIRVYIDERNLPEECELRLVPLEGSRRMILAGARSQYRLRPADEYDIEPQGACGLNYPTNYDDSLKQSALASLQEIRMEIDSKNYHKADMWCHFGTLIIRDPDEADVDETWSIDQATKKLQATSKKRNEWLVAFKEGVDLNHKVIQETFGEPSEEDFVARYDLSFLTPRSQSIRCKVWVARKGLKKKLEDIPIPFSDVKNIVEELHFEDEATRARCRGWLVLRSKNFLQANIVFPGCESDCRINIRALTDDIIAKASGVHEKEATHLLSRHLCQLKFTDAEELILPDEDLPQGYLFSHMRCSHRTLYIPRPGYTMIISKEKTWCRDFKDEETRETTDIHLGREEWERLLNSEDWDPEMIAAELPEFLQFVREVEVFISNNCKK